MTAQRQEGNGRCGRLVLIGLLASALCAAAGAPLRAATTERVVADRFTGLAIGGIDPVAYFTDGRPMVGRPDFEVSQAGAVWRFCNGDNRSFFIARPDIYGPQFGGYDPVDVARGVAVAGNSRFWLISGQRLYLFGRPESRAAFAADPARVLQEARQRWPDLQDTMAR
jgi:hypothetical protein